MSEAVLPLAITMMAGPQIISAITFITAPSPIKLSLAYISGVGIALVVGALFTTLIFEYVITPSANQGTDGDKGLQPVQFLLVGLLIFLTIRSYFQRDEMQQPKWLKTLVSMSPAKAFRLGLLLILFFPSDVLILLTVGATLAQANQNVSAAFPFMLLTIFIAALPLLSYLAFQKKMVKVMPEVRKWTETNSWLINIGVYVIFIFLIV